MIEHITDDANYDVLKDGLAKIDETRRYRKQM